MKALSAQLGGFEAPPSTDITEVKRIAKKELAAATYIISVHYDRCDLDRSIQPVIGVPSRVGPVILRAYSSTIDDLKTAIKARDSKYKVRISFLEQSIVGPVHRPKVQVVRARNDSSFMGCGHNAQPKLNGFLSRFKALELRSRGR